MDREDPTADPKFEDSHSELQDMDLEDAVDVYSMPFELLGKMGGLGMDRARRIHEYCKDKLLLGLGVMETKRAVSEEASVEEIPPPPQAIVKRKPCIVIEDDSVEEISWPQKFVRKKNQPRTASTVQEHRPIKEEASKEDVWAWLDKVLEEEEENGSYVATEASANEEDGGEDDVSDVSREV